MRRFIGAGLLCGLLAVGAVLAQEGPIEIKIKKTGQGDTIKETKTETVSNKITINAMGMEQKKDENAVAKFVYVETVIEKMPGAKRARSPRSPAMPFFSLAIRTRSWRN